MSFFGDDVNDDRLAELLRTRQHLFERGLIVPIDQARVLDAKALEDRRGLKELLETFLHAIRRLVGR